MSLDSRPSPADAPEFALTSPQLARNLRPVPTPSLHDPMAKIVITGGETDVCVLASALGGIDRGYRVVLDGDALCSFVDETHDALMELYLTRFTEQLEVATADEVLEKWG